MEGNCRQKFMYMYLASILTFFILDVLLYVYIHVSCFQSYSYLFFTLVCMSTSISRYGFSIISYSFYFNFFSFFVTFLVLRSFVSFDLCNPYSLHFYCYWFILNHISIWSISSTNHQSTNTKNKAESMKTNTRCVHSLLYYEVRWRYNRYNDFSHLRKWYIFLCWYL